eukprot:scaffold14852_cov33-Phaeocystis_antarctica.AAC.1
MGEGDVGDELHALRARAGAGAKARVRVKVGRAKATLATNCTLSIGARIEAGARDIAPNTTKVEVKKSAVPP